MTKTTGSVIKWDKLYIAYLRRANGKTNTLFLRSRDMKTARAKIVKDYPNIVGFEIENFG